MKHKDLINLKISKSICMRFLFYILVLSITAAGGKPSSVRAENTTPAVEHLSLSGDEKTLIVILGKARLISLPSNATDVVLADPSIASLSIVHPSLLLITPAQLGKTNLIAFDRDSKDIIANVEMIVKDEFTPLTVTVIRSLTVHKYQCYDVGCDVDEIAARSAARQDHRARMNEKTR